MDLSNLKDTIERIDEFIAESKEAIEMGEKLKRLKNNPDFVDVILNGYIEVEAAKLFKILTDPSGASEYSAEQITRKLDAISDFKGYVGTEDFPGTVMDKATRAPDEIFREEAYRKQVTADFAEDEE